MSATFEEMLAEYRDASIARATNGENFYVAETEVEKAAKAALLKYDADSQRLIEVVKEMVEQGVMFAPTRTRDRYSDKLIEALKELEGR